MAKFGVGDTVIGNALNCHGVTCEDCILTVTKVDKASFSGIVDEHPMDDDYVGESHSGLMYDWFDLEESASDIMEDAIGGYPEYNPPVRATPAPSKRFGEMVYVTIGRGPHKEYATTFYEGQRARILQYEGHKDGAWLVTVMFDDGDTAEAYEYEFIAYCTAAKKAPVTMREEDGPKDVKVWGRTREEIIVAPAHSKEKEIVAIKQHYVPTPSFDGAFDPRKTRKKGHIRLNTD